MCHPENMDMGFDLIGDLCSREREINRASGFVILCLDVLTTHLGKGLDEVLSLLMVSWKCQWESWRSHQQWKQSKKENGSAQRRTLPLMTPVRPVARGWWCLGEGYSLLELLQKEGFGSPPDCSGHDAWINFTFLYMAIYLGSHSQADIAITSIWSVPGSWGIP